MRMFRPLGSFAIVSFVILSALIGLGSPAVNGAGAQPPSHRSFLWIDIDVTITGSPDVPGDPTPYCAGSYFFEVESDGGELANAMIRAMEELKGSLLVPDARFDGNPQFFYGHHKLIFDGPEMTIIREDGRSETITLSPVPSSRELLRRAYFPVEPSEENNWEGWSQH